LTEALLESPPVRVYGVTVPSTPRTEDEPTPPPIYHWAEAGIATNAAAIAPARKTFFIEISFKKMEHQETGAEDT
jgi:hypothetical protein